MTLYLQVLDNKELNDSQWILCKGNLTEYLERLKPSFYEYIIQRRIVKNKYLNSLVNTIRIGEPMPIITLTSTKKLQTQKNGEVSVEMNDVEILDGLQRTFRLWAYYKIINEYNKNEKLPAIDFAKNIKEQYPEFFESGLITLTIIKEYFTKNTFKEIETAFKKFDIYFFIWTGLTPKKVIHKMLVLNAGQRPVSLTHQYELLFLYVWEEIKDTTKNIKLFREKDPDANKIKLGDRKVGEYMFSSVIAGLRSFLENKPKRISVDDLDIEDLNQQESGAEINEEVFTTPYIQNFLNKLKETDEQVIIREKENGRKWFVRDTTLSGMLAGLGKYIAVKETMPIDEIEEKTNKAFQELIEKIGEKGFSLNEFQNEYYNLQSRTINVGTYVRKIIMDYTYLLLKGTDTNWKTLFDQSKFQTK